MIGAGGGPTLATVVVAWVTLLAASTVISEWIRPHLVPTRKEGQPLPILPLVADGWSKMSALLLFTGLLSPALVAATKWPPQKNNDGRTATQIIRAIEADDGKHVSNLGKLWTTLPPKQEPWEPFNLLVGYGTLNSQGDVEGTTDGLLLKLLNQEAEAGTVLGPRGIPPTEMKDRWGRSTG